MRTISVITFFACLIVLLYGFWVPAWFELLLIIFFSFSIAGLIYGLLTARFSDSLSSSYKKQDKKDS